MIRRLFGVDLRALALTRIGVGLVLLVDLASRARDLTAHYTDAGLMPREAMLRFADHEGHWSLHLLSGQWEFMAALLALQALAACFVLVGARTRLATVISWILLVSLQNRNILILNNSDTLLRMLLFWGMMLPWGRRWSVDAARSDEEHTGSPVTCSWATVGFVLQTLSVYLFTALLKTGEEWRSEGSALYYALSLDMHAGLLAPWLLELPRGMLQWMTVLAFWFEAAIFFVCLSPWRTEWMRALGVAGILGLHAGIGVSLSVGLFPLICVTNVMGLWPSWVMDRLERAFGHVPAVAREETPAGDGLALRTPANLAAYFFTVYVMFWNVGSLPNSTVGVGGWNWIGNVLRVDQCWDMYAPTVYKLDGWFVLEGTLADGRRVELFDYLMGGEAKDRVDWEKPADVSSTFKTNRWQKYLVTLKDFGLFSRGTGAGRYFPFPYLARYVSERWNRTHCEDEALVELRLYFLAETTTLEPQAEATPHLVWEYPGT